MTEFPRLTRDFFEQQTLNVARELLGKNLVVHRGTTKIGRIIETEAYIGETDLASHARFGRTPRTATMYGQGGHLYVYLIYGMYYLINISTEPENSPAAVLIRALQPIQNISSPVNGPGKVCRELGLTSRDTSLDVVTSSEVYLTDPGLHPQKIITTPRIGISYAAEPWRSLPWRFLAQF